MAQGTSGKNINLKKYGGTSTSLGQKAAASSIPVELSTEQEAKIDLLATKAKQDTGNTSVASIDTKTPALGQALAAASVPVVLTAAQITTLTPPTPQTDALTDTQLRATAVPISVATIPSHAVTNAGTFATQVDGAALTSLQLADDVVKTLGTDTYTEATTKGTLIGAVRRDADTTLVDTTNEVAPLQVDARGALKVEVFSGETLPVSLTSTTVTGTVAVTQSGTWDEVGINDSGNSITVDNGGTFATQVDGAALTSLQLIDDPVFADDAAYTLGTSKGKVIQGIAVETDGTDPTTVSAEGDAASLRTDRQRLLIVNQTHPRGFTVSADYASAQTNTSVKAAPGASLSIYITDITISNGATAGNITLLDGSGGTVLYEIYPAINGGVDKQLRQPIKLTANTALCITSTTVTTHSIFIGGYIAP